MQASSTRRDFGSFHSSNVEELLRVPEVRLHVAHLAPTAVARLPMMSQHVTPLQAEYTPPALPMELPRFAERWPFGQEVKEKHFFLDVSGASASPWQNYLPVISGYSLRKLGYPSSHIC